MLNFDRTNYFDSNNYNEYLKRSKKEKQDNLNYLKTLEFTRGKNFLISICPKSQYKIEISNKREYLDKFEIYVHNIYFIPFINGQIIYIYCIKDEEYKDLIESIKINDKEINKL